MSLFYDLLASVPKPKRVLHVDTVSRVPLGTVKSHRIIRMHSDGRFGVKMGSNRAGKKCYVDFWDGGRELVDADELVDVLPQAVLQSRGR